MSGGPRVSRHGARATEALGDDPDHDSHHWFNDARRHAEARLERRAGASGFDMDAWSDVADFGTFTRAMARRAPGGAGAVATLAILSGLGRGGADRGLLVAAGAHVFGCLIPLLRYGTPAQVATWEPRLRRGATIGALAVTEAAGGSSFDHIAMTAVPDAGGYRLSGAKTLVSNATVAGVTLVLARQFADRGALGLTAFIVPVGSEGMDVTPLALPPGVPGAAIGQIRLLDCFVPADAVLGAPGAGLRVFSTAMCWERSLLAAGALGAAQRDLSACVVALRARGGADPLAGRQAVAHRLARMQVRLEAARALAFRSARMLDSGAEDQALAAMTKLVVSEALVANAEDSLRLMAGAAWHGAAPNFASALDDAFALLFASGTSDVLHDVVARALLARPDD